MLHRVSILLTLGTVAACGGEPDRPHVSATTRRNVEQTAARVAATRHARAPLFDPPLPGNALTGYGAVFDIADDLGELSFDANSEHFDPAHWSEAPASVRELAGSLRVRLAADSAVRGSRQAFVQDLDCFKLAVPRMKTRALLSWAANGAFADGDADRAVRYALTSLRLGDDVSRVRMSFNGKVHDELDVKVLDQLDYFASRGALTETELTVAMEGLRRVMATQPEVVDLLRHDAVLTNLLFIHDADDGRSPRDDVGDLYQRAYDDSGVDGLVDGVDDLLARWERDLAGSDDPKRAIYANCVRELSTSTCEHLSALPASRASSLARHESTYLTLVTLLARRSPAAAADALVRDAR